MTPTSNHGKICYLQIPAADVAASARFYSEIFGWELRSHDDGATAFDDSRRPGQRDVGGRPIAMVR